MLGIVILNYNNYLDTFNCVESIKENKIIDKYQIYIVDNASLNNSKILLENKFSKDKDITLIFNEINNGYSAGNNVGAKKAIEDGCDCLMLTNPDVIFKENAINKMQETLFSDDNCAVVGPKVYTGEGKIQNGNKGNLTAGIFFLARRGMGVLDFHKSVDKYIYRNYDYSYNLKPEGMVSGCCFIIKSKVFEKIGYFDENVFLYHEENILGAKLKSINMYAILEKDAEIIHYEAKSTGSRGAFLRYHTIYSGLYYLKAYGKVSKFSFFWLSSFLRMVFFIKSITNKNYRKFYKLLKRNVKELRYVEKY